MFMECLDNSPIPTTGLNDDPAGVASSSMFMDSSRKRSRESTPRSNRAADSPSSHRARIRAACETCCRLKVRCSTTRPCENCKIRGIACISKQAKAPACDECKTRKIRCDENQPCGNCRKHRRQCLREEIQLSPPAEPTSATMGTISPRSVLMGSEFQDLDKPFHSQFWNLDCPKTDAEAFDLATFEMYEFPSQTPFWPSPLLHTPPSISLIHGSNDWPNLTFDDFDRARLLYDLQSLPNELKGDLPSAAHLTTILRQFFQYVDPFCPFIHLPTFSIKSAPTLSILQLLAVGDGHSKHKTMDLWAHEAYRYFLQVEMDKFENSNSELPDYTVQALIFSVLETSFSGNAKKILRSSHQRVTLAYVCQRLLAVEEEEKSLQFGDKDGEAGWLEWIRRETRRRILHAAHGVDTSVALYYGESPRLRNTELDIPLAECEELWFAESPERWLQIRHSKGLYRREQPHVKQVFDNMIYDDGHLVNSYDGIVGLQALAVGIQSTVALGRSIGKLDNRAEGSSTYILAKCREGLEAWKTSWHSRGRARNRPQYIAVMSAWFCAQLALDAPEVILRMVHRVSTSNDLQHLMASFITRIDEHSDLMDVQMLNNLMTAVSAFLLYIESILGFPSVAECVNCLEGTFFPDVPASIFTGALCFWYSLRLHSQIGLATHNGLFARLNAVIAGIPWLNRSPPNETISVTVLLGNLLTQTKIWGIHLNCHAEARIFVRTGFIP